MVSPLMAVLASRRASATLSPVCPASASASASASSARPSASRSALSVASPAPAFTLPVSSSAFCEILSPKPMTSPFGLGGAAFARCSITVTPPDDTNRATSGKRPHRDTLRHVQSNGGCLDQFTDSCRPRSHPSHGVVGLVRRCSGLGLLPGLDQYRATGLGVRELSRLRRPEGYGRSVHQRTNCDGCAGSRRQAGMG